MDVSDVAMSEFVLGELVCGIDGLSDSDDDLVTAEYRGLRDVDGWQRRDPWGGCADDVPKRASISITPTFISTPTSVCIVSLTPIYSPSYAGSSGASTLTESGKAPPSTDEPGKGETQRSVLNMTEEENSAPEERARKW